MNKRILLLTGAVMVLTGLIITVMFDVQPYIPSTVTFLGLGIIFVTLSRSFPDKNIENE